jgi:hypothetical protein
MVHGFLDLIGLMEGALLVWSEFAKGFCTGVLGRTILGPRIFALYMGKLSESMRALQHEIVANRKLIEDVHHTSKDLLRLLEDSSVSTQEKRQIEQSSVEVQTRYDSLASSLAAFSPYQLNQVLITRDLLFRICLRLSPSPRQTGDRNNFWYPSDRGIVAHLSSAYPWIFPKEWESESHG